MPFSHVRSLTAAFKSSSKKVLMQNKCIVMDFLIFVLKHDNKQICIVEAKKNDFEQGYSQDLVGCEAVADGEIRTWYMALWRIT